MFRHDGAKVARQQRARNYQKGVFNVIYVGEIPGSWVRSGGRDFEDQERDNAHAARYLEGLCSLCERGFVVRDDGTLFMLTGSGFEMARERANDDSVKGSEEEFLRRGRVFLVARWLYGHRWRAIIMSAPNQKPFTIHFLRPDGTGEGVEIVTKSDWTGIRIVCPRSMFTTSKEKEEFTRAGVFFIAGPSEEIEHPAIYIGKGDSRANEEESHIHAPYPSQDCIS